MKKLNLFAVLAIMMVTCMIFVGCNTASDFRELIESTQTDTVPDPAPTPIDTTKWSWNGLIRSDLTFDTTTEMVSAYNIGQISNTMRTVFDSIPLVYHLGVELSVPRRVVVESQDTTVLGNARTSTTLNYSGYILSSKDSVCTVSTDHAFPTQYYDITATTTSKRGYSLHAGHWEPFKYVTESAQWRRLWHEPITEITLNDSVFNREVVHNELVFIITSNKGKSWYINREEVVIVDHFLKMKEGEKEEETVADDDLKGLARFISATKVYNTDTKLWGDAYLFEGSESYRIFVRWYTKDDSPMGKTSTEVSFSVSPKSNDYNAVAYIKGGLYPGLISQTGKVWDIGCYINGSEEVQGYGDLQVDFSGIKNFTGNNTAYPSPYIAATPSTKTVNGYKVISVTGKTSVHTSMVTIADSLLKK